MRSTCPCRCRGARVRVMRRPPEGGSHADGGATRARLLRRLPWLPPSGGRARGWLYGGLGVAAATIVAVLFVAPTLRNARCDACRPSEILAKSASQLSATVTGGVELLEYELVLDGVPKEMMPDGADGTYHVKQAIDHNVPGRFRFASYGPDGGMLTSIAQDPQTNRRVMAFTVDGQPYRFEVSLAGAGGRDVAARNGAAAHGGLDHDDAGERQPAASRRSTARTGSCIGSRCRASAVPGPARSGTSPRRACSSTPATTASPSLRSAGRS